MLLEPGGRIFKGFQTTRRKRKPARRALVRRSKQWQMLKSGRKRTHFLFGQKKNTGGRKGKRLGAAIVQKIKRGYFRQRRSCFRPNFQKRGGEVRFFC